MAGKYHYISALAEMTAADIVKNENEWTRFLTTAARLYKYPFNEQMLIYAQRPDATACASLETWNEKMNCWVNRGAKGIALIDTDSERSRLKYVFDVSDVHKARRIGRDPYLWELREEHKAPVLAQLEKTYGATDVNMPFEERVMEIADRIVQDYYEELLPELNYVKEGSFLDDLDELNLGIRWRETLASSISFTLLSRCGADMDLWKDDMNFEYIHEFNNTKSLAVIGNATTEMCKPLLMEIGRTIGAYERQIARQNASNKAREKAAGEHIGSHEENVEKGLANAPEADYNALKRESETTIEKPKETENHTEMEGIANETDIRKERGLSDSEPDSERGAEQALTKYGLMRKNFLKEHRRGIYQGMILTGELKAHCLQVQEQAEQRMELLTGQMAKSEGVNEELKAADQMGWVAKMNNIRHSAEEIVLTELIYI